MVDEINVLITMDGNQTNAAEFPKTSVEIEKSIAENLHEQDAIIDRFIALRLEYEKLMKLAASRMNDAGKCIKKKHRKWTPKRDVHLTQMYGELGMSFAEIGRIIGETTGEVAKQAKRLGLTESEKPIILKPDIPNPEPPVAKLVKCRKPKPEPAPKSEKPVDQMADSLFDDETEEKTQLESTCPAYDLPEFPIPDGCTEIIEYLEKTVSNKAQWFYIDIYIRSLKLS